MNYELLREGCEQYDGLERIFYNRYIEPSEIEHYLTVSEDDTNSPKLLKNINAGINMLIRHIKQKSNIGLLVDCDVDGYCSSALLYNYLTELFPTIKIKYFIHENKEHGLKDSVDKIIQSDINLVLVPDAGSGDGEYIKQLKEKNIDVIIIDHHNVKEEECAPAIVINNQIGDYPNKTLAGVGVVYKFCEFIDILLNKKNAQKYLDLVSVGCVADLMPLNNYETLFYIRKGLENINNNFLKELIKNQEFSILRHGILDPFCIGFYLAPYMNATIRVGTIEEKTLLFEAMLDKLSMKNIPSGKRGHKGEPMPRVEESVRIAVNAKTRQTKLRDENLEVIEKIISEKELLENNAIIAVKLPKELQMDKNILGLMANILMDKYQRPILLLNEVVKEDGVYWEGSARNYKNSQIENLRGFFEKIEDVEWATGHNNAFGISIKDENFNDFIKYTNEILKDFDFSSKYKVDFVFSSYNLNLNLILDICSLKEYWGQDFEEPLIAIKDLRISNENIALLSRDKNPTLKITLDNGLELIKFNSSSEELNSLQSNGLKKIEIDLVGTCDVNYWNGRSTPQIKIKDYEITGTAYDF